MTLYWVMKDDQLHNLLRQWRDVEAPGNFEANVWRRIRQSEASAPTPVGWLEWLWRPGVALAASITVSVMIGVFSGIHSAGSRNAALDTPPAHTLTGGYLTLTTERPQ